MSDGLISLFFGAGVAAWLYAQLARRNGNASPQSNAIAALSGGVVVAIVFFTVLKFILHIN